jgi:hypothetical protein
MLDFNNRPPTVFRALGYVLSAALVLGAHLVLAERAAAMLA